MQLANGQSAITSTTRGFLETRYGLVVGSEITPASVRDMLRVPTATEVDFDCAVPPTRGVPSGVFTRSALCYGLANESALPHTRVKANYTALRAVV